MESLYVGGGIIALLTIKLQHLGTWAAACRMLSSCGDMRHHCFLTLCFIFNLHYFFGRHGFPLRFAFFAGFHSRFVIIRRFPGFKSDRPCRATRQTISKAVTEVLSDEFCFSVYHFNSAIMYPKTLQYLMGHSDIGVTMNTYTHLGLEDALEEVGRMQELENARKEQEKLAGKKEETKVSKKMFRAG